MDGRQVSEWSEWARKQRRLVGWVFLLDKCINVSEWSINSIEWRELCCCTQLLLTR